MKMKAITIKNQSLDLMALGDALAQSGYFQDARSAAQAVVKVLAGQELGLGPIASMTGIHIIQGKPSLSANAMAAVIKNHPTYDYKVRSLSNEEVSIEFFENGESLGKSDFTIEDAAQAGLTSGANSHSWKKFPRNMLFARAMSNGAKWYCPDAFSGVPPHTPDEFDVMVDGETGEVIGSQAGDDLEFQQQLEVENRQGRNGPPSVDEQVKAVFYATCQEEFGLTAEQVDAILAAYKVHQFNPDRAEKYLKAIEAQLAAPTCEAALLVIATQRTNGYYQSIHHLWNAVKKANPNFDLKPQPLKDETRWQEALSLAVEYGHPDEPEQSTFGMSRPEEVFKYE